MTQPHWYSDPSRRFQFRYWDGTQWTEHVWANGQQQVDPVPGRAATANASAERRADPTEPAAPVPSVRGDAGALQQVLAELGIPPQGPGDGTAWGEPVLLLVRSANDPTLMEWWTPAGTRVAFGYDAMSDEGAPATRPPLDPDVMVGTRMLNFDARGTPLAWTTRTLAPAKPPILVDGPDGRRIAVVKPLSMFGTAKYGIELADGRSLTMKADGLRARSIALESPDGRVLATVYRNGAWGASEALDEMRARFRLETPVERLARTLADTIIPAPMTQDIGCVVVRHEPLGQDAVALVALLMPLLLEHHLSLR